MTQIEREVLEAVCHAYGRKTLAGALADPTFNLKEFIDQILVERVRGLTATEHDLRALFAREPKFALAPDQIYNHKD